LFYLDMDRFSLINDLEGHEAGDRLLTDLVQIWRGALRGDYLAARMSADEFCLFVENLPSHAAMRMAENLRKAVDERRFLVGRETYHLSVSIGVALLNGEQSDEHPSNFIARARQSCATAKGAGGNMAHLYNPDDKVVRERQADLRWVPVIREALKDDRFYLMFQPIVRLSDLSVSHYEVLVRMRDAKGEEIQPGHFIPAAERMGLIHKIDFCVVERAIDFLASLPSAQKHVEIAVNLSTGAFMNSELLSLVREKLELTWVDATRIMFEITETSAVTNYRQTRGLIASLRGLGCRFALDDFGAGFCSFDYLKNFPVDYVKIDGQFVRNLPHDDTDQMLVRSMTDIAHKLGKRVVAEYVDNAETLALLRQFGVDYGQGYYFGPPARQLLDQPLAMNLRPNSAARPFLSV
jgi:diguanylate cyclase (GGDEF)-like protein